MRVFSRIALVVVLVLCSPALFANHFLSDCPLTLVATNPPATQFDLSPHGVFRSGNLVYALRGQTLTTYNVTALGDLQVVREDFIGSLGARETEGGVAFSNGYLYVSAEPGLEIFDLRNVRAGGGAPILVSRTAGLHYRRLAINGNILAGLYPATDLPCYPTGTTYCYNTIDIFSVSNLNFPVRLSMITSYGTFFLGFNDIAFNYGYLVATSEGGTASYDLSNPSLPSTIFVRAEAGKFLVSNGSSLLGVGDDGAVEVFTFATNGTFTPFAIYPIPNELALERTNPLMFHHQAWFDDQGGRLITMVDEKDPTRLTPARTIAFDVFDFSVPMYDGFDPRIYESISLVEPDEIKYNPLAAGPNIFVLGEQSGLETYGACGIATGKIEFDFTNALICGGAEIHGWVTGVQKITNVELFIDGTSLGAATLGGPSRTDISAVTTVSPWRINVNLDSTARGEHLLRAVATDILGNRRQFSSSRVFFNGPGLNCTTRRRATR